jgi:acetolactate synthase-1/2/3 large subunit
VTNAKDCTGGHTFTAATLPDHTQRPAFLQAVADPINRFDDPFIGDFDKPYRHAGDAIGTATQIGMSLGVGLAHKGSGKLVVALQPDGDLMFDVGALWTAAKHRIPILIVMFNNRAYYNDWHHQIRMANLRGTDVDKAHIGMDIFDPEPDFGAAARAMGMWGEGPIDTPEAITAALRRAIEVVKSGKSALVDVVTQHR